MINNHLNLSSTIKESSAVYKDKACYNVRFPNDDNLDELSSEVHTYTLSKTELDILLRKV